MDSRIYGVPLSATPVAPKAAASYTNAAAVSASAAAAPGIRAPLTIDDSDFEYSSRRNSMTSSYGSGESEGFLSGDDDFESASEIPNLPLKSEGSFEETHSVKDYAFSGPSVIKPNGLTRQLSSTVRANAFHWESPDEELARERDSASVSGNTLVRPVIRESDGGMSNVVGNVDDSDYSGDENVEDELNVLSNGSSAPLLGDNIPVIETKAALVEKLQVPVAKISVDSDYDSENSVVSEDEDFSDVRVSSTGILLRLDSTPKARLTDVGQGDDEHDLKADNASDMEFGKEMVGSEDELEHFGVDGRSIDIFAPSDVIQDKEVDANALVTGEEHNSKFKLEQNEDDMPLDEEILEIDVISDLRKCADLIYQREHSDLGSISSVASTAELSCSYGTVELMEHDVTELGYGNSSFGSAFAEEKYSSKSVGEQNGDLMHFTEEIEEIDVISYQEKCVDSIDKTEPTAFKSIPFADSGEAPGSLSGTVNLAEPGVTELGECISKFGAASTDDGDQNNSHTASSAFSDSSEFSVSEALAANVPADVSGGDNLLKSDKETKKAAKSSEQLSEVVEPNPDFLPGGEGFVDQLEVIDDQIVKYSDDRMGAVGGSSDELLSVNGMEKLKGCSNYLSSIFHSTRSSAEAIRPNLFDTSSLNGEFEEASSGAKKVQLEKKIQQIRVKYLQLLHRLGCSSNDSVASKVLHLLTVAKERISCQTYHLESTRKTAMELEASKSDSFDFSVCILVIGKTGVGKSSTINSIFGEQKTAINAFEPATTSVKEIIGTIDGVKLRVIDTPGLRTSSVDEHINRKVLLSVKRVMRKFPPDVILYVDRLDAQTSDLNDLPMLKSVSSCLGSTIWRKSIVVLTHAIAVPPDGPDGCPLSHETFVAGQSLFVQQLISHSAGEFLKANPGNMIPVSLVENHPFSEKNEHVERLPFHGGSWKSQLLLLCYSIKTLSEVSSVVNIQNRLDIRKIFGLRIHSPSQSSVLSSLSQPNAHPKLSNDQNGQRINGKDDTCLEGDVNEDNQRQQTVCLPMRNMPLRPSFDRDITSRVMELSALLLTKLIFNASQWNHGHGYDDNSVSPLAVLDVHTVKTEFRSFKRNETAAEVSLAFLNENEVLEFQVKDHIPVGERLALSGNAGVIASQTDAACAASVELCKAYQDYPISLGLSVMKYGGDLTCGCSMWSQISVGRSSKLNIRAGLNNKRDGRISIKMSCSDQLHIAALALLPVAKAIFEKVFPRFAKDPLA